MLKLLILQIVITFAFTIVYAQNTEKSINALFFPAQSFLDTINTFKQEKDCAFYNKREQLASSQNELYSEKLLQLNEIVLYNEYYYESYRITRFGYFGVSHNPLSVRIENHSENVFLIVKYIHCSNYNHKKQKFNNIDLIVDTVNISKTNWEIFKNKINNIDFWNISPVEKTEIVVMDGSTWIFEGKSNEKYHMVYRNVDTKEIREICLFLLKLSNTSIKKKEFY